MPDFIWVGKDKKNRSRKGKMEAPNEAVVQAHLQRIKITPSKIKPAPKDLFENIQAFQPRVNSGAIFRTVHAYS